MADHKPPFQKRHRIEAAVSDGGRPPLDRVLEALSRECDRCILYTLMENEVVELDDVIDEVLERESGEPATTASDDVRREIRAKLHHQRLPKLEDLGIVEYDHRNGSVRYRNPPPHFEKFLQLARELDEG